MTDPRPCLAATLINPREPQHASSYLWCKANEHAKDTIHTCYCDIMWLAPDSDLVELTPEMLTWRTGTENDMRLVSTRMLG